MAEVVAKAVEPDFITYLLDPKVKHDCYFLVGNEALTTPVRIGAVKKMLMAHSEVLRKQVNESKLAEKGVIAVNDLYPDTFKNLLKYVYGYDNITLLSFEEADDLLYASQKYLIMRLKNKVAVHLASLLTYENICTLMNNPVCFQHLELDSTISKILQTETDKVFASPQFHEMISEGFLKILEQDSLAVKEIEVWRAALQWAKHKANTEDGAALRQVLTPHLKHIRLCTLNVEDIFEEVEPTNVLSDSEVMLVCKSAYLKKEQDQLVNICKTIDSRTSSYLKVIFPEVITSSYNDTIITVLTKESGIELSPFEFIANSRCSGMVPRVLTYQCLCTITITRITNYSNNTSTEPPLRVSFDEQVKYREKFFIPITNNGMNIQLLPNNKYAIRVCFNDCHTAYLGDRSGTIDYEHFSFQYFSKYDSYCGKTSYVTPIKQLMYRTVSKRQT